MANIYNGTPVVDSATGALLVLAVDGVGPFQANGRPAVDDATGAVLITVGTIQLTGYTVATLPTGSMGQEAYVTDAQTPTYLQAVVGGGTTVCPVFFNGTAWVAH